MAREEGVGAGDPGRGEQRAMVCFACHGPDGQSLNPEYSNLAGQKEKYIIAQLVSFKSGARKNPIMNPMAGQLSDQDIADIAAFFSGQMPAQAAQTKKKLEETETRYEGAPSGVDAEFVGRRPTATSCRRPTSPTRSQSSTPRRESW
jgi:cytochrome c553